MSCDGAFQLRYMLASCMYGYTPLAEILPEVGKTGATAIDIWPQGHGNQREQLAEMGEAAFAALLQQRSTTLGCITQYKLGPFGLAGRDAIWRSGSAADDRDRRQRSQRTSGQELKTAVRAVHREDETAPGGRGRDGRDDRDRESRPTT